MKDQNPSRREFTVRHTLVCRDVTKEALSDTRGSPQTSDKLIKCVGHFPEVAMKYMMLVYLDEQAMSESEREHCYVESAQLTQQLNASGQYLHASPLHPVATATSVRVRGGKRLVTDGPFAETREQLGGYYLVDADDLDEAIEIAGRIPGVHKGTIEVRPVLAIEGLPEDSSSPAADR